MFKRILLPTDGSPLSEAAVQKGVQFAKFLNAAVIGIHVIPKFHMITLNPVMLEDTEDQFAMDCKAQAERSLVFIERTAADAGVPFETSYLSSDRPDEAIVGFAKETSCDLIAMASHGRGGLRGVLLGSVTQRVLSHTDLPVLVFR